MLELLWYIISNALWPIKGIIMMEERLILYSLTIGIIYLGDFVGVIAIMLIGLTLALTLSFRRTWNGVSGFFSTFCMVCIVTILNIVSAWFYLVYGAINGRVANTHVPRRLAIRRNSHNHVHVVFTNDRPTWHYQLGRGIYRLFFRGVNWVLRILHIPARGFIAATIARALALVVILWGVWYIPQDIINLLTWA